MAVSFEGAHFPQEIILTGVRWYVAYPLSTRHIEELMLERGVHLDHSTINRWGIKYSPQLEEAFHRRKRPVWISWRMDETYIRVQGEWRYCIPSKIRGWKSMPWRVATMKESGHNSSRSASLPLLEPEALCLKTLTCPALPMNGHASWSSSC